MTFENKTILDRDALVRMHLHLFRRRLVSKMLELLAAVLLTVLLCFAFDAYILVGVIVVWIALLFDFANYLVIPRLAYKSAPNYGVCISYVFTKEGIAFSSSSEVGDTNGINKFSVVKKVTADKYNYYFNIGGGHIIIINKGGFAEGCDLAAFESFLFTVIDGKKVKLVAQR